MPKKKEQTVATPTSSQGIEEAAPTVKRSRKPSAATASSLGAEVKPARKVTTRRTPKAKAEAHSAESHGSLGSKGSAVETHEKHADATHAHANGNGLLAGEKAFAMEVTHETISVRAYFLGEHRRALGIPGDSHGDWLEAERQLKTEAASLWN